MKTTKQTNRVFAVRMGPKIELRVADEAPRKRVSELTSYVEQARARYVADKNPANLGNGRIIYEKVQVPFIMKQVFFEGGDVLGYVRSPSFERKMGISLVKKDVLVELTGDARDMVLRMRFDVAEEDEDE